jgi:ABC-type nitrate/sulfonate/bicarbonate transport system permease component
MKSAAFNQFLPWILPFILWQGLSSAGILGSRVLPSPVAVLIEGVHLTRTGELPLHLFESFRRAATGLMIGGNRVSAGVAELLFPLLETGSELAKTSPQYLSPFGEVSTRLAERDDQSRLRASAP